MLPMILPANVTLMLSVYEFPVPCPTIAFNTHIPSCFESASRTSILQDSMQSSTPREHERFPVKMMSLPPQLLNTSLGATSLSMIQG